jgi:hypothetical protein
MNMFSLQGEYLAFVPGHSLSSICAYCMGYHFYLVSSSNKDMEATWHIEIVRLVYSCS